MIDIRGLKKSYGNICVLNDINLHIDKGSIFGLAGRSGAGKSTLLRCINGLESYDDGNIDVDGTSLDVLSPKEKRAFRKSVGMIFQHFSLLKQLDAYGNVALPLKCWGYKHRHIDEKVKYLLSMVGLNEKIKAYPSQLSGGQKQRVAIARALAMEPKILLCDEATSALDPKTAASILDLLKQINEKTKITIIIVTHQMQVIRSVCHQAAIIEDGKITASDEVEKLFIEEPQALKNLTGNESYVLDNDSGTHVKVTLHDELTRMPIFSLLSRELGVDVIVVNGETNRLNKGVISSFIISIPEVRVKEVARYLGAKNIKYEVIPNGNLIREEAADV